MKFKLELPIEKPRAEVWKAFDNPENMKLWQPLLYQSGGSAERRVSQARFPG